MNPTDDGRDKLAAQMDLLRDRVYQPAFFETLAELGHVPQTRKQAEAYFRMGQRLLLAEQEQERQQAAGRGDFVVKAAEYLDQLLDGGDPAGPQLDEEAVKRAAAAFAGDPEIAAVAAALTASAASATAGQDRR